MWWKYVFSWTTLVFTSHFCSISCTNTRGQFGAYYERRREMVQRGRHDLIWLLFFFYPYDYKCCIAHICLQMFSILILWPWSLFLELKEVFPSRNDVHARFSGVYPSSSTVSPFFWIRFHDKRLCQDERTGSTVSLIRAWSAHCFDGHWKEKQSTFSGTTRFLEFITCLWLYRQLSANWGVEVSNKTYVASAGPHFWGHRNHSSCQASHNSEERMQVSSKKCLSRLRQHDYWAKRINSCSKRQELIYKVKMPKYCLMNRCEWELSSFLPHDRAYLGIPQRCTYVPLDRQPHVAWGILGPGGPRQQKLSWMW